MDRKKQRGQKRKLKALLKNVDNFTPFKNTSDLYERFLAPCGVFISSPKTSPKIKTSFCKAWIQTTENFIIQKPKDLPFCKVVAMINSTDLWYSQIIIFYDEEYYSSFWDRATQEQSWTLINPSKKSFIKEHNIITDLKEVGYLETITDIDYIQKSMLWFYGDI